MADYHTLDSVQIPRGMLWVDEFKWSSVERVSERSITGALIIDASVKTLGRSITLEGTDSSGWMTRGVLKQLSTMSDSAETEYVLALADGRVFDVRFAPDGDPIEAEPIAGARPELPTDSFPYRVKLRLVTV